ncbi:GNAT family N-acetyltransferase [Arthrobacter sp. zg-Y1219]|uniref:GNAT family N-acetyltransferase n=1 Tax=Arthrobacter sp. zg-Y1219 TaxID=3049067 RepID=UPI0024C4353B|nr:GNAT family N-acetyltransferase [Arthrobacter sp. zg-Y1219]MDK1361034.1 GNAT family N-acetyltransferase [Arthrobacter sp. zg-Y1219]
MSSPLATAAESILSIKAELDFRTAAREFPDAAFRRFGQVSATRLPVLPDAAPYNKARGLSLDDRCRLDDITAFYAETGQRPRLEVWAGDDCAELQACLSGNGLAPAAVAVTLHARPCRTAPGLPPGVRVAEVDRDDQNYLDVLSRGYSMESASAEARRVFGIEHSTPGLRRYLATVDGEPAAAAALFSHGNLSLFVGAATLPAFRRRGCQSALIHRRLADASETSDLTVATATVGSASSGNLERHGFAVTHLRTLWF